MVRQRRYKNLYRIGVLACLVFVGCVTIFFDLDKEILAKGMTEHVYHIPDNATIITLEKSDKIWQCEYAPWINKGNYIEVFKTDEGCKYR